VTEEDRCGLGISPADRPLKPRGPLRKVATSWVVPSGPRWATSLRREIADLEQPQNPPLAPLTRSGDALLCLVQA